MPAFRPEEERFWDKVVKTDSCWLWTAGTFGRTGDYGCFYLTGGRKAIGAHIWSWEQVNGPVPEGLVLDHLCEVKLCVRPDHLNPTTHQLNILKGTSPSAVNSRKMVCNRGHSLEDAHVLKGGRRDCRKCRVIRNQSRSFSYRKIHG